LDAEFADRLLVADPQIDEVLDLVTGKLAPAESLVTGDYQQVLEYRLHLMQEMRAGRARHACPICAVPVHLVRREKERRFHFRHETEDGRCPVKTKGKFSGEQILAMKYDGARESQAHRDMKELIAASLRCDPDFSEVEVEPIWKGIEKNSRRRPDVRALWKGRLPVAFEVQLSTTFLRVIAERREFYMRNGGLLLWVFKDFEMGDARLMQDDIFYNNNRNAFVASPATLEASLKRGKLALDCVWSEPVFEEGRLAWKQERRLATFAELVVDAERQRVFLFDAEAAKANFDREYESAKLRADFRRYWLKNNREFDELAWNDLRERLASRGVDLPSHPGMGPALYALLDTLYSVAEGRPVGWGHSNLVKIAHHVFERHPGHLWMLKLMLAAHGRGDQIKAEDASRRWRTNKVPVYREAWAAGDDKFDHDPTWDDLVRILFPEIAKELRTTPH
jgi:hypothetical protein